MTATVTGVSLQTWEDTVAVTATGMFHCTLCECVTVRVAAAVVNI